MDTTNNQRIENKETVLTVEQVQPEIKPDIKTEIKKWFDIACAPFKRFSAEMILCNETPYDIERLYDEFVIFYYNLTGRNAKRSYFDNEVNNRCKKPMGMRF